MYSTSECQADTETAVIISAAHTFWYSSLQLPPMPCHESAILLCKAASIEHSWRKYSCNCYQQTEVTDRHTDRSTLETIIKFSDNFRDTTTD